jgi:hypothetical protein
MPIGKAVEQPVLMTPTPEQIAKGGYERPTERGSLAVYTNKHNSLLAKLRGHGAINGKQQQAGCAFEATWVVVNGSPSPSRDSTIPAVGGTIHESEPQAERWAKAKARTMTILNRIGPQRYSLLVSVCCFGEGIGSNRGAGKGKVLILRKLLCESLDQCAIVYGINEEAAYA